MQLHVFSVHDAAVGDYMPPMFYRARGEAMRTFADTVNGGGDSLFTRHPEHFTLFYLGVYDTSRCLFELLATPEPVAKALDVFIKKE